MVSSSLLVCVSVWESFWLVEYTNKKPTNEKIIADACVIICWSFEKNNNKIWAEQKNVRKKMFFPFCIPYFYADASSNSVCIEIRKTPVSPVVGFHLTIFTRFDFSILRQIDEWQVKGGRR